MSDIPWISKEPVHGRRLLATTHKWSPAFRQAVGELARQEGISMTAVIENLATRNGKAFTAPRKQLAKRVRELGGNKSEDNSSISQSDRRYLERHDT